MKLLLLEITYFVSSVTPYFTPLPYFNPFFDLLGGALYGNHNLHP